MMIRQLAVKAFPMMRADVQTGIKLALHRLGEWAVIGVRSGARVIAT